MAHQELMQVEQVSPSTLTPHPLHVKIYGDNTIEDLIDSVKELGVLQPLFVTSGNIIFSGYRRWRAAVVANLEYVPIIRKNFDSELDMRRALIEHNRYRIKTGLQLFNEGKELESIESEKAQDRVLAGKKIDPVDNVPQGKTRDIVAQTIGLGSGKQWDKLSYIGEHKPELLPDINKPNGISINKAYLETRHAEKEQERQERRADNTQRINGLTDPLVNGVRFATIMLDPPWDWGDEGDVDQLGRARPTYGTIPFDQLLSLPITALSDEDCHLYLWITNRSLPKGFALIEQWGFRYVTCLTWCKPTFGMGNYFRGQTEHLLFAIKGSQPLKRRDVGTWFAANRGKRHSSKPIEAYELIESCSPAPYLEIFARTKREHWTSWGADVG